MTGETTDGPTLQFGVLGPLEVLRDERPIEIAGAKQRALLTQLLLRANEVVSRDRLVDGLWGDNVPEAAANALAALVARLRKTLSADVLLTRPGGYELRITRQALDLHRFETLAEEGSGALAAGNPARASESLHAAIQLWRGAPLADFSFEPFAQPAIMRLEELRLVAIENRIEADLALGRHLDLLADLRSLLAEHPLRDRLRGQLMLALYRSGRQADALEVYREGRRLFVDELGIEPGPALQELEKAILQQDAGLASARTGGPSLAGPEHMRAVLVAAQSASAVDSLLALAVPLARSSQRELILVLLATGPDELSQATTAARERSERLSRAGVAARAAAFVSMTPGDDVVRFASGQSVDLALLDPLGEAPGDLGGELGLVLDRAPCDIGVLVRGAAVDLDRPVLIPFGGGEHEWAAMELGAWLATAGGVRLELLGTAADPETGRRDASRLLAAASLVLQQAVGVTADPVLVAPGSAGVIKAAAEASLTLLGIPELWRTNGLDGTRLDVAMRAPTPVLLVRGGVRPGGLAPHESLTRYTWTLSGAAG
jgi:DNA-binding SARP family transcriptional activator